MTINTAFIESMLNWGHPSTVTTVRGLRQVRTATPDQRFWAAWKQDKQALQAQGISPKPLQGREWIVKWFTDAPAQTAEVAASQAPSVPQDAPQVEEPVLEPVLVQTEPFEVPYAGEGRSWSSEQEEIFRWFHSGKGSLVVRARAGTGKTTTIKTAFMLAPEAKMLYCVFNKKNQCEAAEAIADTRVEIKTLHSLGFMFIKQVWTNAKPDDDVENDRVDAIVGERVALEIRTQVKKLVGFAKNTLINPTLEEMIELAQERDIECPQFESFGWNVERFSRTAMKVMEASKVRDSQGRISFNDMVWLPVAMGWTRACFDLVVVDEAQDMNLPQLMMARAACRKDGRVCVVGDDRQAIYGFRGAASDGMNMMRDVLNASELGLTITYRCPKAVVRMAAQFVHDYKAADAAPEGIVVEIDARNIASQLQVGDAVLSRSNAPLMPLCLGLLSKGIPARIEGRDIGKTLCDIVDRIKARSVPDFLTRLQVWSDKQRHRHEGTKNYEKKAQQIQDQADTLAAVAENAQSVADIRNRLTSLFQDSNSSSKPAVVLSTTHKAKGLEWDRVVILNSTYFKKRPANTPALSPEAEAMQSREEANIYYVAVTRAKSTLVLAIGDLK